MLALFAQDSISVKRLTVIGGVRFEQLEGYLPAQSSPASPFADANVGGFAAQPRSYAEIRNIVKWNTAGPRVSAIYDLKGDGKTAVKASYGRYYYILSTGGGGVSNVNHNANYSETYGWNDANGDHKFELGEQTGAPVVSAVVVNGQVATSIDPNFRRPYTDEFTASLDRELMANTKLGVVFTYRREKYPQVSINPANPYATTLTTAVDPGPGRGRRNSGRQHLRVLRADVVGQQDPHHERPEFAPELQGRRDHDDQAAVEPLADAGGVHARRRRSSTGVSLNTSPNLLINANGNITDPNGPDRPNQFKLTGMYILPFHDVSVSGNLSVQQGVPITRQISRAVGFSTNEIINLEPLGNTRLDPLTKIDLRIGKVFKFGLAHARGLGRLRQPDQRRHDLVGPQPHRGDDIHGSDHRTEGTAAAVPVARGDPRAADRRIPLAVPVLKVGWVGWVGWVG